MALQDDLNDAEIRAYLLGKLPPDEAVRLKQTIEFTPENREIAEAIEEELIDDYARGRLSPSDAQLLEVRYLNTPEGRAKIGFAKSFVKTTSRPWYRLGRSIGTAAAAIVLIVGGFVAGRGSVDPVVSLALRPGAVRSLQIEAPNTLSIHDRASVVEFLLYPDRPQGDNARLLTTEDRVIASAVVTHAPGDAIRFLVPAQLLHTGSYIIELRQGRETVATFVVHVEENI